MAARVVLFLLLSCASTVLCQQVAAPIHPEEREAMVETLNSNRSHVQPPAANMATLKWDNQLASEALAIVKTCDEAKMNKSERGYTMGSYNHRNENFTFDFLDHFKDMFNMSAGTYNYENNTCRDTYYQHSSEPCQWYRQIVWAKSSKFGCGKSPCAGKGTKFDKFYFFCLFDSKTDLSTRPYVRGKADPNNAAGTEARLGSTLLLSSLLCSYCW